MDVSETSSCTTPKPKPLTKKEFQELIQLKNAIQTASEIVAAVVELEDIAVFLGSTRAGKSTLINFLIGNDLIAERASKFAQVSLNVGESSIGPKIGIGPTSETMLPSRWTSDRLSGIALWDAPGFDDNRGEVQDITNAFYIKELLANVKSAKVVLVTDINDIVASDNVKPFLSLMKSVENIFGDKMEDCLSSIAVIFTKVPKFLYGSPVSKEFVSEMLQDKFMNNPLAISKNVKKLIKHLIENINNFGFFNKVEDTCEVIKEDLDSGIEDAILQVDKIDNSVLKDILPSISQDSKVFLFTKQNELCSLEQFKMLLTQLETVYTDKLVDMENSIQSEDDEEYLKNIGANLSKIEGKVEEITIGQDASLHDQLMSINTISPEVKSIICELKMLEKAKILEFIDGVLQLKHNCIFSAELSRIKSSIMLKLQNNNLNLKEKLGELTKQQAEEMKQNITEKYAEENSKLLKTIAKLEKHNRNIGEKMGVFAKVGQKVDETLVALTAGITSAIKSDSCNIQ